jgi:hypothetical protein
MRAKIHRLTNGESGKVDASDYGPEQVLNSEVKTGMRPISRRAYKKGGKVVAVSGADAPQNAGKKQRSGSKHLTVDALVNRNLKDANEDREGKKHIGGLKTGGRAKAFEGSAKDEMQDKKLAKKYGMSMESWEKSKMDDKHDSQKSMKGLKKGGRADKSVGGVLGDAGKFMLRGGVLGAAVGNKSPLGFLGPGAMLAAHLFGKKKDGAADKAGPAVAGKKEGGGLYANIHAKRERIADGSKERMRKAGSKGAPTEEAFKKSARTAKAHGGFTALNGEMQTQEKVSGRVAKQHGGNLSSLEMNKGGRAKRANGGYDQMPTPAESAESDRRMMEAEPRDEMDYMNMRGNSPPKPMPKPKPKTPAKRMPPPTYQMPDRVPSSDYKKGGRTERKSGGRTKGKTDINIVIATGRGQQGGQPDMPPMPGPQGVPVQMPSPPPQAAAPMPMPMPMPMPPAGGPGPGPAPMPRKAGGRTYRSYKDMDAGAGSGLGRAEKTEIQKHKK